MWGWGSLELTAFGTLILAAATAALVLAAFYQIRSFREEAKKTRTLAACEKYDTDPVLDNCLRKLRAAWDDGSILQNSSAFRIDVVTVLNHLDGIAIGIEQGLYIEELVRDHHEKIFNDHFDQYLASDAPRIDGLDRNAYLTLRALCEKWSRPPPPRFRNGWRRRKSNGAS